MKLRDLAAKVHVPTYAIEIVTDGGVEKLELPRLSIGDWKAIKNRSSQELAQAKEVGKRPVDMWAMLLAISDQVDEATLKGKTEKEKEDIRRKAGMRLFQDLDHNIQLMMFHRSLSHIDPEVTEAEADSLISYGIPDQADYMKALMFLIYGVRAEDVEGAETPLGDQPPDSPSKGEQSVGEEFTSSSRAGTGSRKKKSID